MTLNGERSKSVVTPQQVILDPYRPHFFLWAIHYDIERLFPLREGDVNVLAKIMILYRKGAGSVNELLTMNPEIRDQLYVWEKELLDQQAPEDVVDET